MLLLAEDEERVAAALAVQRVHHHAQVEDLANLLEERNQLVLVDAGRDLADVDLQQAESKLSCALATPTS